jgi:hypothetical protein
MSPRTVFVLKLSLSIVALFALTLLTSPWWWPGAQWYFVMLFTAMALLLLLGLQVLLTSFYGPVSHWKLHTLKGTPSPDLDRRWFTKTSWLTRCRLALTRPFVALRERFSRKNSTAP